MVESNQKLQTAFCIIGSGPAAHTAAIYAARAELSPILFEGWMANGIAAEKFRQQSLRFGTKIFSETVERVDLSKRPFKVHTEEREVEADTLLIATGAVAKRLNFKGADESEEGFWNKGISACAVCDGAAPIFRSRPLAVIGGGDSAMEEAIFLTKFGSVVYIIHRRDAFRASKIMQKRVAENPKIKVLWNSVVTEAVGNTKGLVGGIRVKNVLTGESSLVDVSGLFFAIGHEPATKFLDGQLETDAEGYIITKPGTTQTSVSGVFAAGDVQDKKWRQAITSAGTGCMAALEAEHFLQEHKEALNLRFQG
ncbi:hypothetical protein GOP47_0015277 [Adiantum capillus-veneris]|uniref:thioredoxin-disulfide reductase (NADPH) n=1 Tax=Adiantum capillus-veneris TaxID=13818 RepID=A0A9D4UJE6_ADICA|nr:hypothetical protein GOP47_0015277 [Adiantum capillus-veneris]